MTHNRLHGLADGIFAIVMTLLVLDLKVPALRVINNHNLLNALSKESRIFISYIISFTICFLFWRAHAFIVSTVAKNLDANLVNLNMLFLLLVGLIPFTTQLAGTYASTQAGLIIYAVNIILIGVTVYVMRLYVENSSAIENDVRSRDQLINAKIRVVTPITFALVAIPASFFNTWFAFGILLLGVGFNLLNNAAEIIRKLLRIR